MIQIDTESREPLVTQTVIAIERAIVTGELQPLQELPSVRQLSGDLGVHWNTVSRAYRQLADKGLLFVGQGRKTYVKDVQKEASVPRSHATLKSQKSQIQKLFKDGLSLAKTAGFDRLSIESLFGDELRRWETTVKEPRK